MTDSGSGDGSMQCCVCTCSRPVAHPPHSCAPTVLYTQMMKKSEVIRLKQTEHVAHERALLRQVNHPFVVIT